MVAWARGVKGLTRGGHRPSRPPRWPGLAGRLRCRGAVLAAASRSGSVQKPVRQTSREPQLVRGYGGLPSGGAGLSQPLSSHPPSSLRHTDRLAHEMMSRCRRSIVGRRFHKRWRRAAFQPGTESVGLVGVGPSLQQQRQMAYIQARRQGQLNPVPGSNLTPTAKSPYASWNTELQQNGLAAQVGHIGRHVSREPSVRGRRKRFYSSV